MIIFEKVFDCIDQNEDRYLDFEEFDTYKDLFVKMGYPNLKFETLDANHSGKVSITEIMK